MTCVQEFLEYTGRDIVNQSRDSRIAYEIYSNHCEGSKAKSSTQTSVALDAVVKAIPVKFALNTGSNEEKLANFCKTYTNNYSSYTKETMDSSLVVREALKAFESCINLASHDIFFSPKIGRTQVAIEVRRGSEPASLQGVTYDSQKLTCQLPPVSANEPAEVATEDSFRILEEAYLPIQCQRTGTVGEAGATAYPYAEITVGTNRGAFQLPIPEDALLPSAWASDLHAQLDALRTQLDALKANSDKTRSDIGELKNKSLAIKITSKDRLNYGSDTAMHCPDGEVVAGVNLAHSGANSGQILVYCSVLDLQPK